MDGDTYNKYFRQGQLVFCKNHFGFTKARYVRPLISPPGAHVVEVNGMECGATMVFGGTEEEIEHLDCIHSAIREGVSMWQSHNRREYSFPIGEETCGNCGHSGKVYVSTESKYPIIVTCPMCNHQMEYPLYKKGELAGPVGSRKEKLVLDTEGGNEMSNISVPKGFPGAHMMHGEVIQKMVLKYLYENDGYFESHYDYMIRHGWTYKGKEFDGTAGWIRATWEKYE